MLSSKVFQAKKMLIEDDKELTAEALKNVLLGKSNETRTILEVFQHHNEQMQLTLNKRTKVNTVHISLNFDPSEKLDKEQLAEISKAYLKGIGFEKQPALVYEHRDAGHPHVHLVTTNIKADGSRISLHNLGKNQSEKTRREIEIDFGLVKAQDRKAQEFNLKPVSLKS